MKERTNFPLSSELDVWGWDSPLVWEEYLEKMGYEEDDYTHDELEGLRSDYEQKVHTELEKLITDAVPFDLKFEKYDPILGVILSTSIDAEYMLELVFDKPDIFSHLEDGTLKHYLAAAVSYYIDEAGWSPGELLVEIYDTI